MDELGQPQNLAAKPLKMAESQRPDRLVEPQTNAAVATVLGQAVQDDASVLTTPAAQPFSKPGAPHPSSISNISTPLSKLSPLKSAPQKKSMTPRRFVTFVGGLFIAGVAGSLSNWFMTAVTETAFPPQYVKDFHKAQALPDREKAFTGMHLALTNGQKIEPLSHRFTELTVALASQLENDGRYLEAKTEWAKAALPSEVASPEFRERKRSYIINEAESEHRAFLSKMTNGVDLDLLKEVEDAAFIFQKSEVSHHGLRAVNAFIAAGELVADNKEFASANHIFDVAEMIANAQWQNGGSVSKLLDARWQSLLQQTVAQLSSSKRSSAAHLQYVAGNFSVKDRLALENDLAAQNWDKLDSAFDNAEKKHLQSFDGDTVVSDMYSALATPSILFVRNRERLILLEQWANARPHSVRPSVAMSYFYNARAEAFAFYVQHKNSSARMRNAGFSRAHSALAFLQQALRESSEVAAEPSFIKALQTNVSVGGRLSGWPDTQAKLISDLQSATTAIVGDDAQFNLDQISNELLAEPPSPGAIESLLKRAADLANKIGGDAGDEFYARAVARTGAAPTSKFLDRARLTKGASLLAKKYGTPKNAIR